MTAGIPGVGIGGIFYLLSALAMPFREAWQAVQGRSVAANRRLAIRQASIAVGILASMWGTAALLEFVVKTVSTITAAASTGIDGQASSEVPRLLTYSAFALSITTLIAVLTLTQFLRLLVPPRRAGLISNIPDPKVVGPIHCGILRSALPVAESGRSIVLLWIFLVAQPTLVARPNQDSDGNRAEQIEQHLAAAHSAFADEDSATAEREYRAALELDPDQSRATFRLAQLLERTDRAESEKLYRHYQDLEPTDAWGHIVLAELLGREGRYGEALDEYAVVMRIAPEERDAVVGQARMLGRSGRTDQAIERYEGWLASHPDDGEAWEELSRERWRAGKPKGAYFALEQAAAGSAAKETGASEEIEERRKLFRRSTAPAVEPLFSFGGDSDGNTQLRAGVQGDFAVTDGARLGVLVGRSRIADSVSTRSFTDFGATARWRPRAAFELDAMGGAVRRSSLRDENGVLHPEEIVPIARVRARAVASGGMARLDVRFNRSLLDATPTLVANQIVRNEVRVLPEFAPIRRFKVRALGGIGSIHGGGERNIRNAFGGGIGWNVAPAVELSGNYTLTGYSKPSRVGYFAPDRIQTVDAGSYMEFESSVALIALDFGVGAERVKGHGEAYGSWRRALRAYGMFSFPLRPGRELRLELEGYDTQAGPIVAPTSGWKYGSVGVSFRWSLP